MYYFLKKYGFNLENYKFNVDLISKLTKKESQIIKILLDVYDVRKDFNEIELGKLPFHKEEVVTTIESLMKKIFHCEFYDKKKEVSKFYFNIFEIVAFEEEKLIYNFSSSVIKSIDKHNIFSRIGISFHLTFQYSWTKTIYRLLLKENKHKGVIELSLSELKELLGMTSDKYPRFYDFENKVLNPIMKDIEITENFIWFEKVKEGNSRSSKIMGVKIHYTNLYNLNLNKETNKLLREYADYIEDFSASFDFIYQYLKENDIDKTTEYLKQLYKSN